MDIKSILGETYTEELAAKLTAEIEKEYKPLSDFERLQSESKTAAEKHASELSAVKLNGAIENRLLKEGAVNTKAVRALLDGEKIKLSEDGSLTGLDEQLKTLREREKWAFAQPLKQVPGSGANPAPAEETKRQPLPSGTVAF